MKTTAERIKEGLALRNMKQSELVEKTGISKSSISTYIKGSYEPKQRNVYKIAKALGVNEAWLMGYDVTYERKSNWDLSAELDQLQTDVDIKLARILEIIENAGYTYDTNEEFNELVIDGPSFSKNFDISDLISSFEKLNKEKLMADALLFDQTENFSDDIQQIIDLFNKLNKEGQKEAVKQIDNLTYNPKYTKSIKLTPVMKEKPTNGYVIAAHNDNEDPDQLEKMERDGERMLAEAARRRAKRNE